MKEYISFDSHKHYTLAEREDRETCRTVQRRIDHAPGAIRDYLRACEPGTPVAVEAIGNWYWIIDEIEQAGLAPVLVNPRKAKLMMGMINEAEAAGRPTVLKPWWTLVAADAWGRRALNTELPKGVEPLHASIIVKTSPKITLSAFKNGEDGSVWKTITYDPDTFTGAR